MTLRENEMPNPLAIDAHAHICTEETMKLLEQGDAEGRVEL